MCDLPKDFLEAATKEILGIWKKTCEYERKPSNIEENLC